MFRFAAPYFLFLLIPIIATAVFRRRRVGHPALANSSLAGVRDLKPSSVLRLHWLLPTANYTALLLLVIALARPQMGVQMSLMPTEGINIILALDLSESMAAMDFKAQGKVVDRLTAVKTVVRDFVGKRHQDRIGMVVFGSEAYTQLPLTRDYDAIVTILERLQIGSAGPNTAIGDAIGIAIKRMQDIKSKSNIIVLMTDGESNSGQFTPAETTQIARGKNIKIYTIGVGTRGRAPFLIQDPFWGQRVIHRPVHIDEKSLQTMAEQTGGLYFKAENTQGLDQVYAAIDQMETTAVEVKTFAQYDEIYRFFLVSALGLLVLVVILGNTRYLRLP